MLSAMIGALLTVAAADTSPCTASSTVPCCNPFVSPPQLCPGQFECQACGGSSSCECPSSGPGPSPPSPMPDPTPTPTPPAPSPAPPASNTRLKVVNGCSTGPMWIAHIVAGSTGPDVQDVKILPGASASFQTELNGGGLSATRYWPKMGCDANGGNCALGDSGGPGEGCVIRIPGKPDNYTQCSPPVDTKFEATFAAPSSSTLDCLDMSLVDGYTLPFKLETRGSCTRDLQPFDAMDCSGLSLSHCPTADTVAGATKDLRAINPKSGELVGCYSPCLKLSDDKWNETMPVAPDSHEASPYCCAGSYGSPPECAAGGILQTQYMISKNQQCPMAYGYPYDDKVATIVCTTTTRYTVTFYCPSAQFEESLHV